MAKAIKSWQQLEDALLKPTARAMSYSLSLTAKKHLKEEIQEKLYDRKKPESYQRTKDFLKSVKIERSTIYGGRIYQNRLVFDYKKIHPVAVKRGWNKHMDVHGQDFNKGNLVQVLEEGTQSGLFQRDGTWFIANTKKWLEEKTRNNGFTIGDVTMMAYDPETDEPPERVPVGIRIRKRA